MALVGGCLCGSVRYEIGAELTFAGHCHCSRCRRAHGAAFATWAGVAPGALRWIQGEELVERFASSPGIERGFCRRCGAPLVIFQGGEVGEVVYASLDGEPGLRPTEHIFVGSKAPWHDITDGLPQHHDWPPGFAVAQ